MSEIAELIQLSKSINQSSIIPYELRNEKELLTAILFVKELGLPMVSGLQNISIIKGKPTLNSHLLWALVFKQADLKNVIVSSDNEKACVKISRSKGDFEATFSINDAKKAGLVKEGSGWIKYPKQMLEARAKSLCARLAYPEALFGIYSSEELRDVDSFSNEPTEVKETPVFVDSKKENLQDRSQTLELKKLKSKALELLTQLGVEDINGAFDSLKKELLLPETPTLEQAQNMVDILEERLEEQENQADFTADSILFKEESFTEDSYMQGL